MAEPGKPPTFVDIDLFKGKSPSQSSRRVREVKFQFVEGVSIDQLIGFLNAEFPGIEATDISITWERKDNKAHANSAKAQTGNASIKVFDDIIRAQFVSKLEAIPSGEWYLDMIRLIAAAEYRNVLITGIPLNHHGEKFEAIAAIVGATNHGKHTLDPKDFVKGTYSMEATITDLSACLAKSATHFVHMRMPDGSPSKLKKFFEVMELNDTQHVTNLVYLSGLPDSATQIPSGQHLCSSFKARYSGVCSFTRTLGL